MPSYMAWFPPHGNIFHSAVVRPAYRGGSSAPAWTPAELFAPGDVGWLLDGSTADNMYIDTTKSTIVTASGVDRAGAWADQSGLGNDYIQGTTGNKPLFFDDGGIWSVLVGLESSANRFLQTTQTFSRYPTAYTRYSVSRTSWSGTPTAAAVICGTADGRRQLSVDQSYGDATGYVEGTADTSFPTATPSGTPVVFKIISDPGLASDRHQFLRSSVSPSLSFTRSTINNNFTPTVDEVTKVQSRVGNTVAREYTTKVCFVFEVFRLLTTEEQTAIESYIASKFGGWTP